VEVHIERYSIFTRFHLREGKTLLPVPVGSAGFRINCDNPAAGKLRDIQDNDKNPEKHDGTDTMAAGIAVACHPGDLDCRIFTVFPCGFTVRLMNRFCHNAVVDQCEVSNQVVVPGGRKFHRQPVRLVIEKLNVKESSYAVTRLEKIEGLR